MCSFELVKHFPCVKSGKGTPGINEFAFREWVDEATESLKWKLSGFTGENPIYLLLSREFDET